MRPWLLLPHPLLQLLTLLQLLPQRLLLLLLLRHLLPLPASKLFTQLKSHPRVAFFWSFAAKWVSDLDPIRAVFGSGHPYRSG